MNMILNVSALGRGQFLPNEFSFCNSFYNLVSVFFFYSEAVGEYVIGSSNSNDPKCGSTQMFMAPS